MNNLEFEVRVKDKSGEYRVIPEQALIDAALKIVTRSFKRKAETFTSPDLATDFFSLHLAKQEREVFSVAFLDNRNRLIECEDLFFGTVDGASVHPREVVKAALKHNAAAVIMAHNHPSGVAEPSRADEQITTRLVDALSMVDVRVLDHIIVGEECVSLAQRGLI